MRTILLDADILAYKAAAISEDVFDFGGDGSLAVRVDEDCLRRRCDELIVEYCEALNAAAVVICLTDPKVNFRKQLEPTYKSNRKGARKPELLNLAKEYLAFEYPSYIRPRLEADDIMGILATRPGLLGVRGAGDVIIVSEDKDMRTVPALVYNPNYPKLGVQEISELDADRFHMWQTIVGDPTDGYPGCPGIGMGGDYVDGQFVQGSRTLVAWAHECLEADRTELWDIVLMAYASKGLTEEDAILQARLARILRHYDYSLRTRRIRLWTPLLLS